MSKLGYLQSVLQHPVNVGDRAGAIMRMIKWYVGSRLVPGPVAVPFIEGTRLLVNTGLRGATENIYTGLSEFEDMAFALHLAREDDLFVDVGANVGAYSVLLAGVRKCKTIAIEPNAATCVRLRENVALNGLGDVVDVLNLGVGDAPGRLSFTASLDCMNHVVLDDAVNGPLVTVDVVTLDDLLLSRQATVLKVDVEGFETRVLVGAARVLNEPTFLAAIVETNESGRRYGYSDAEIDSSMASRNFSRFSYMPAKRQLTELRPGERTPTRNTIYVRDRKAVEDRLKTAPPFRVGAFSL